MGTDDGTIRRPTPPRILPIFRPIITDGTSRFPYVLEIGPAEIFVLLHIKPEIENIFRTLSLKEETATVQKTDTGERCKN